MTVKEAKQKNRQVSLSREIREEPIKKMLPTPTTQEFEHKDMELTHTNRRKTKDGKDSHSLNLADTVRLCPTPTSVDYMTEQSLKTTGSLNPDWVEWLMGYGQGYTDPDNKDKFTLDSHQGFPNEPEIARVTTDNQYRKDRLKALGNSIVPQIAYHIGNAILEQEKT